MNANPFDYNVMPQGPPVLVCDEQASDNRSSGVYRGRTVEDYKLQILSVNIDGSLRTEDSRIKHGSALNRLEILKTAMPAIQRKVRQSSPLFAVFSEMRHFSGEFKGKRYDINTLTPVTDLVKNICGNNVNAYQYNETPLSFHAVMGFRNDPNNTGIELSLLKDGTFPISRLAENEPLYRKMPYQIYTFKKMDAGGSDRQNECLLVLIRFHPFPSFEYRKEAVGLLEKKINEIKKEYSENKISFAVIGEIDLDMPRCPEMEVRQEGCSDIASSRKLVNDVFCTKNQFSYLTIHADKEPIEFEFPVHFTTICSPFDIAPGLCELFNKGEGRSRLAGMIPDAVLKKYCGDNNKTAEDLCMIDAHKMAGCIPVADTIGVYKQLCQLNDLDFPVLRGMRSRVYATTEKPFTQRIFICGSKANKDVGWESVNNESDLINKIKEVAADAIDKEIAHFASDHAVCLSDNCIVLS